MATKRDSFNKASGDTFDRLFTGAQESSQNASEGEPEEKSIKTEKSSQKGSETAQKGKKKSFSFRADPEKVDSWRLYAIAKDMKVDDLGESALQEYTKRHKLTEAEQAVYDLKLSQRRS